VPSKQRFVIAGASLAGAKAAETLRSEGFDGEVVLIGEEPVRPYERPPLSKDYLRGEKSFDDAAAVHSADFYDANGIDLRKGTVVTGIDAGRAEVATSTGERVGYDRLLLTVGAEPRRLSVPGAQLDGVRYLRTVEDSDALRHAFSGSPHVVVIGAGWIGSEVAASARQLGADVALVELASVPLERVLGQEVGTVFRDLHADHGVDMHFGVGVDAVEGGKAVEQVRLTDGAVLPAQVVVAGIGVAPRTALAESAGLELDNGVAVDEYLATTVPGIYAAGDVANAFHPRYGTRIRLEHWSAALNQGPAAARNMMGQQTAYDRMPYFFSDQYDLGMEYRGWAPAFESVVFRGDVANREFIAFWINRGSVVAAMNVNIWDAGDAIEALLDKGGIVDPERLADPEVDLAEVS
jgi:3-phenylpropionate/trans-cinnamate dioxygenase ferredoxin reductase component